ncbi:MAG: hypothetical protein J5821_00150 [Alphaproteobacteria bacterium]|nr:hypothetical protein [Alphaproteobacteria bacterium]
MVSSFGCVEAMNSENVLVSNKESNQKMVNYSINGMEDRSVPNDSEYSSDIRVHYLHAESGQQAKRMKPTENRPANIRDFFADDEEYKSTFGLTWIGF